MNRRVLAAVAVAALVLLAGCGGADQTATESPGMGGESPEGTAEGTPTASATSTPTPSDPFAGVSMAPGTTEDGVTNASELLAAHASALDGRSVTVDMDFTLEVNGSGQNVSFRGKVTPDDDRGWMRIDLQDGTGTYYTESGTTYQKVVQNGETSYGTTTSVSAIPTKPRFGADIRIRSAITAANWTATGVVERDGEQLIRYEATDVDLPDSVNVSGDTTTETSGTLLVGEDGAVHYVAVHTRVESSDETVVYSIEVDLTDVGSTTVERPDWVDEAA